MATRAAKSPVKRIVVGKDDKELMLVVEGRSFSLKPLRVRDPSATVVGTWGTLYERLLYQRAVSEFTEVSNAKPRKKRVARGRRIP